MMLKGLLDFVLQTLSSFQFDLMKSNADFEATAISLWDFANEFFESPSSPVDVKNAALSILLAVALRTGTVNRIIRVVQYLFRDDVMVDRRIYGLIHTICDILPNFNLYPPSNKVYIRPLLIYSIICSGRVLRINSFSVFQILPSKMDITLNSKINGHATNPTVLQLRRRVVSFI